MTITPPKELKGVECVLNKSALSKEFLGKHGARKVNLSSKTLWNRTRMGMMLPGEYWLLTLTSSALSPPSTSEALARKYGLSGLRLSDIKTPWLLFWKTFWRRHWPGADDLWVSTPEGHGVIHAVLRFPVDTPNIPDVEVVRAEWVRRHKAFEVDFGPVDSRDKTANYLLQIHNRTAQELLYQPAVLDWSYSRGWLPVGLPGEFGRAWWTDIQFMPEPERSYVLRRWQFAILKNKENLKCPPRLVQKMPGMSQIIEDYYE